MHKFKILKNDKGQYRVQFVYNAEVMVWSENYSAKSSAQNCIDSMKKNTPGAAIVDLTKGETGTGYRFEIDEAKNGETFVRFRASNGEIMVRSETYKNKSSATNCATSIQKNSPDAPVEDES
ncbi:YegP family protein [Agrobacterium sp. ES01]|uniref:YegP family protein n=1 Tax=Agrobacterium sp. ES01 TaxID=3420714 RepID=UPI003D0E2350